MRLAIFDTNSLVWLNLYIFGNASQPQSHVTNISAQRSSSMDEWGSSVWATPSNTSDALKDNDEQYTSSQSQTIPFNVDDAFDDISAPSAPGIFSTIKLSTSNVDAGDTLDANVNGTSIPIDEGFGDFDDFAAVPTSGQTLDDDFGDFGDFGAGTSDEFGDAAQDGFGSGGFGSGALVAPARWQPLPVDPLPPSKELSELVGELLGPIWANLRPEEFMSGEPERQVEGVAQILVTPERCVS